MRKGIIPMVLGVIVSAVGMSLLNREKGLIERRHFDSPYGWGILGFGLAHILLGGIDSVRNR